MDEWELNAVGVVAGLTELPRAHQQSVAFMQSGIMDYLL
jgi:hypothetical protein